LTRYTKTNYKGRVKTPSRNLSQRLVLYALSAGAVVGIASTGSAKKKKAEKEIHYSGPEEFSADDIWFDLMDHTPPSATPMEGDDFKLFTVCDGPSNFKGAGVKGKANNYEKSKIAVHPGKIGEPDAIMFHGGETIGPQNFFFIGAMDLQYYNSNTEYTYHFGDWRAGDRGFLGLKIIINCQAYYGWADVTYNTPDCIRPRSSFTLHSYAFNSEPNESIAAGEKKAKKVHLHLPAPTCTPTPSPTPPPASTTSAIGLLIAGAAGIASLKQRRQ
jgi:hypothetical protein